VDELQEEGIHTTVFDKGLGFNPAVLPRMIGYLKRNRIQIVHTHMFTANFWGRLAGKLAGVPILITTEHQPLYRKRPLSRRYPERLMNRITDRVIAVAETVKDSLVKYDHKSPGKISVLYNGIDLQQFEKSFDAAAMKADLGIDPSRPLIGVVARLFKEKGHADLFDALVKVKTKYPEVLAFLVGHGPAEQECRARVRELGISENVFFAGLRRDVPALLRMIDFFVLPSLGEGLSIAILEAMAAGRAVVATDVGGNWELVDHGKTGLLVPAADPHALSEAIIRMISEPQERIRMGNRGRALIFERFSLAETVKKTESLYEELLRERGIPF
ncbi:MAG: glycosyltransferase, partial [Planctomycetes bacterium]|nr:glycosyltransferase [Planctomycetota bacterium]